MLRVEVNFVDGGAMDWAVPDSILHDLARLRRGGLDGRELVDALLTDDWGPPPRTVTITGTTADGQVIRESIGC